MHLLRRIRYAVNFQEKELQYRAAEPIMWALTGLLLDGSA